MEKKYKYKLIKTAIITGALTIGVGGNIIIDNIYKTPIPYTTEDLENNITFQNELNKIQNEEVEFKNEELASLIKLVVGNEYPTKEDLKKVENFEIPYKLNDNYLSDLKYLTNLSTLTIKDNDIDCNDIKYNINLYNLSLSNCNISNTEVLPNSINNLIISNSNVLDERLITPYDLKELLIRSTVFNNLTIKNNEGLKAIQISTNNVFDLNTIANCNNLEDIAILQSTNIRNSEILTKFRNASIIIDDYASIWLSKDTYNKLNLRETADNLRIRTEINKLDEITNKLISPEDDEETRLKNITLYVIKQLEYDKTNELDENYNIYPMYFALNRSTGICINYSCLWQALANRANINSYILYNDNHSWNCINDNTIIDATFIDSTVIVETNNNGNKQLLNATNIKAEELFERNLQDDLYYYQLNLDEIIDSVHEPNNLTKNLSEEYNKVVNIGYINPNTPIRVVLNGKIKQIKITALTSLLLLMLMTSTALDKTKSIKSTKDY